jgi:Zn-dependent alcohol dehydrogenase
MHEEKLLLAQRFGATHPFSSKCSISIAEQIRETFGSKKIDVVVDCTGAVELIETGLKITADKGRMILVGLSKGKQSSTIQIHNMRQHFTGKKIIFSNGGNTDPNTDIPRYLNLYRAGKLNLDDLITHHFSLEDINKAFEKMLAGDCGRCLIEMP